MSASVAEVKETPAAVEAADWGITWQTFTALLSVPEPLADADEFDSPDAVVESPPPEFVAVHPLSRASDRASVAERNVEDFMDCSLPSEMMKPMASPPRNVGATPQSGFPAGQKMMAAL